MVILIPSVATKTTNTNDGLDVVAAPPLSLLPESIIYIYIADPHESIV